MKYSILFCIALFLGVGISQAQIIHVRQPQTTLSQYQKSEWDIQVKAKWDNPYLQEDIALDMVLQSPSGKQLILPCFYVSGSSGQLSQWKARFAPKEKGGYQYHFVLKQSKTIQKSAHKKFNVLASDKKGMLRPGDNWGFVFDDGTPFRGIGENICWESRDNDDSKYFKSMHENDKYSYEKMLPALAKNGGNYFRTWICRWNLPIDWKKNFNNRRYTPSDAYYNPSAVSKLDRMVNLCDSLGLYVMLTLGPGAYLKADGGQAVSAADFFVNPASKTQYKNRLRFIVARWGYSSAIGAWEFFNEVDNVQFAKGQQPINGDDITQWHDEMSTFLKQIDPYNHLVTTSVSHRDVNGMNDLKNIDFNQKHIYKATQNMRPTIINYATQFKKPYVIGEFGYEWDWTKNFQDFADSMDYDYKRGLWYGLFSPTPIIPLSWWWEFFESRGTDGYIKNVRQILDRMEKVGKGRMDSIEVTLNAPDIEHFAVTCGPEVFVYLNNRSATTKMVQVSVPAAPSAYLQSQWYDCEKGLYDQKLPLKTVNGQVRTEEISLASGTDRVLVLSPK